LQPGSWVGYTGGGCGWEGGVDDVEDDVDAEVVEVDVEMEVEDTDDDTEGDGVVESEVETKVKWVFELKEKTTVCGEGRVSFMFAPPCCPSTPKLIVQPSLIAI
jgi:hypothetical protein